MRLALEGTTSANGGCPTMFRTDHGTRLVQGTTVADQAVLADLGLNETVDSAVEVPAELLLFVDLAWPTPGQYGNTTLVGQHGLRRTERGTLIVFGTTVIDEGPLAEARKHGNGIPSYESLVEVPANMLQAVDVAALPEVLLDSSRPEFVIDAPLPPAAARG